MTLIKDIGEREFIKELRNRFDVGFIGDDAAVMKSIVTPVITTDSFLEGTHFHKWWTSPEFLAVRLLEATLSDLAAMGASPVGVLSSIMLPPDMELQWLLDFYKGLTSCKNCPVIGGETIKGPVFCITLTAFGECGKEKPLLRSAVKPGDSIWVTGPIGRTLNSVQLLEKSRKNKLNKIEQKQVDLFLTPKARFDVIPVLRKVGVLAAIDISDGLLSECNHLATESNVGIRIDLENVPIVKYGQYAQLDACTAGEDFELLFSASPETNSLGRGFFKIGEAVKGSGIELFLNGSAVPCNFLGYEHFDSK